jgi:hypothetical protein
MKEFIPDKENTGTVSLRGEIFNLKFKDGSCRLKLVRGFWVENCSPRRGSKKKTS